MIKKQQTLYSAKFKNISKARYTYFFLFFFKQVYMLSVKIIKPLHVTSYHIKPVKRCQTRFIVKVFFFSYVYLSNSSFFLNDFGKKTWNVFQMIINSVINRRILKQTVFIVLIQTSVVTNSKEEKAEKIIPFMYYKTCYCAGTRGGGVSLYIPQKLPLA